ncbi:hypothetical protein JXA84_06440 [candidate division WOR-3 bacterium]|nr:hypothetical protein [candidate division WOR-3 bacterium]
MKRIILISVFAAALIVFGCTKDDNPTNPGGGTASAPTTVTITATSDGYGVVISWTAVASADSYQVEYPGSKGYAVVTGLSYTHNDPTELGAYRVRTFVDNDTSGWSSSVSTAPYTGSGQLGEWSYSSLASCYYWTTTGTGTSISRLDPNAATLTDIFCYYDNNELNIVRANQAPLNGTRQVSIAYSTDPSYVAKAPSTGYANYQPLSVNGYFWVHNGDSRYVRVRVTILDTYDFDFSWVYQPVSGFRYVD